MISRIIGVFRLSPGTFDEIKHSEAAFGQAAIIVAAIALLSAFRNGFLASRGGVPFLTGYFLTSLVWTFVGWFLWAAIVYLAGTAFFGGQATFKGILQVVGFAYAPQVLLVIPCIGWLAGVVWSLAAGFVAVRQYFELDSLKAALTMLIGTVIYIAGGLLLGFLVGRALPLGGL